MNKKLHEILLIDDSDADNFINSRVIRKAEVAEHIVIKNGAQEALDYLVTKVDDRYPQPDIIFLDINMPGKSGWDFLSEYQELEEDQRSGVVICMLTTSYAERDKEMARQFGIIQNFSHKPLTREMLMGLIEEHFPG